MNVNNSDNAVVLSADQQKSFNQAASLLPHIKIPPYPVKEMRTDLRLYYGYTATQVRKMKDSEVISAHHEAIKDIKIEGCKSVGI